VSTEFGCFRSRFSDDFLSIQVSISGVRIVINEGKPDEQMFHPEDSDIEGIIHTLRRARREK